MSCKISKYKSIFGQCIESVTVAGNEVAGSSKGKMYINISFVGSLQKRVNISKNT
jgi:hypothetical protein